MLFDSHSVRRYIQRNEISPHEAAKTIDFYGYRFPNDDQNRKNSQWLAEFRAERARYNVIERKVGRGSI